MFEMAAFLHSRERGVKDSLVVCPTFVGPALLLGHFGLTVIMLIAVNAMDAGVPLFPWGGVVVCTLAFPCLTSLAYVVFAHGRSIEIMQRQVRHFEMSHSRSFCCDNNHVAGDGQEMVCDRKIIGRCITYWFGSGEHFENVVRTAVLQTLVHQLSQCTFTYMRVLQATSPMLLLVSKDEDHKSIGRFFVHKNITHYTLMMPCNVLLLLFKLLLMLLSLLRSLLQVAGYCHHDYKYSF